MPPRSWSRPLTFPPLPLPAVLLACVGLWMGGAPPSAHAEDPAGMPGALTLGAAQGLPQQTVFALASDAPGHVWVGTQDGLARWDGRRFERYPLPDDTRDWVTHLERVGDSVWVGTDRSGLYRLGEDRLSAVPPPQGSAWPPIEALVVARDGGVWVGTPLGLNHCTDTLCTVVQAATGLEVAEVLDAPDGTLWVGTNLGGLHTLVRDPQGVWQRGALHLGRAQGLPNDAVRALARDDRGRLWIGTGRGMARWDGQRLQRWTQHQGAPLGGVFDLLPMADGSGAMLAALWGGGLGRWNADDSVQIHGFAEGLPDRYLQVLLATGDAAAPILWLGSGSGGVLRIEAGRWRSFDERHGLPQRVVVGVGELPVDHSAETVLWAGTLGGSVRRAGAGWVPLLPAPYAQRVVYDLVVQSDGTHWYATDQGVLRERSGQFREYTAESDGVPATAVEHLLQRPDGLWLGTGHGLARIIDDRLLRLHEDHPEHGQAAVRSWLALADGSVLIGGGDGLLRSDGTQIHRLHASCNTHGITYDLERVGVAPQHSGATGAGAVWLGTRLGVQVLHGDPAGVHHCAALPEPGRGPRTVYELVSDAAGRVYLFGYDGVRVYDPALGPPAATAAWTHAGLADGLPALEFNRDALRDAQGRIWAASTGGLVALDPMARSLPPSAPTLRVALKVAGAALREGEVLPAWHGEIEVRPRLLSFRAEHRIRYRSWLEGLEDGWSDWRSDVDHRYSRLPAGRYRHHVQARDAAGQVFSAPVLSFHVAEPVWRHPLTLGVAALLLVLAGLGVGRLRARTLARRALQLEALVAERTRALETLSSTDPLTGAWNRRHFHREIQTWLAHSAAHGGVILALVDLDHFKRINDGCGHAAGDAVLVAVAACLRHTDPLGAQVVRWGGEEFLLVLAHAALPTPALRLEQLRQAITDSVHVPGASGMPVTVSIGYGIATGAVDGSALERLLHAVDAALYRAKRAGRNRVVAVEMA